ncbi:MAG: ABC transporter ATP-binding protein [Planctomycetes bacterium]|nr:ABC transporter ATP-binding protein [Planctomycetota bacterium]
MDSDLALVVSGVSRRYRDDFRRAPQAALDAVDLTLGAGEAMMLAGLNGAGKSTFLRLVAGIERPDEGQITVLGKGPRHPSSRRRLAYLPDGAELFPFLDVRETLAFFAAARGLGRRAARAESDRLIEVFGMEPWARKRTVSFSTGMRRRLALASALIGAPDFLLLDEPASGLDPEAARLFLEVLRQEKARGATILMASHHLAHVEGLCDQIAVLARGRLAFRGAVQELARKLGRYEVDLSLPAGAAEGVIGADLAGSTVGEPRLSERALEDFLIAESRGS